MTSSEKNSVPPPAAASMEADGDGSVSDISAASKKEKQEHRKGGARSTGATERSSKEKKKAHNRDQDNRPPKRRHATADKDGIHKASSRNIKEHAQQAEHKNKRRASRERSASGEKKRSRVDHGAAPLELKPNPNPRRKNSGEAEAGGNANGRNSKAGGGGDALEPEHGAEHNKSRPARSRNGSRDELVETSKGQRGEREGADAEIKKPAATVRLERTASGHAVVGVIPDRSEDKQKQPASSAASARGDVELPRDRERSRTAPDGAEGDLRRPRDMGNPPSTRDREGRDRDRDRTRDRDRGQQVAAGASANPNSSKGGSPRPRDRYHRGERDYHHRDRGGHSYRDGGGHTTSRSDHYRERDRGGSPRPRGGDRGSPRGATLANKSRGQQPPAHLPPAGHLHREHSRNGGGGGQHPPSESSEAPQDVDLEELESDHADEDPEARAEREKQERLAKRAAILAKHQGPGDRSAQKADKGEDFRSGGDNKPVSSASKELVAPPSVDHLLGTPYGALASPSAPSDASEDVDNENQPHLNEQLRDALGDEEGAGMAALNEFIRLSKKEEEATHRLSEDGRQGPDQERNHSLQRQKSEQQSAARSPSNKSGGPATSGTAAGANDNEDNIFGGDFDASKKYEVNLKHHGAGEDDWNNAEGYYVPRLKEVILDRYEVIDDHVGKGVFGNVVRCIDRQSSRKAAVAIKFIRQNAMMAKAAVKEITILNRLAKGHSRGIIRLLANFEYRGHTCMVFDAMDCSLREGLKKFSKEGRGVSVGIVQKWTVEFMAGLRHIHKAMITHADIKPDNVLVNDPKRAIALKICDLGSACDSFEKENHGYIVSRWYRPPEVIIEANWDQKIDIFSAACTIWECLTHQTLFPGVNNNDQLKQIMDKKGKLSNKMIKSGDIWKQMFDPESMEFVHSYTSKAGKEVYKKISSFPNAPSASTFIDPLFSLFKVDAQMRNSETPEHKAYVQVIRYAGDFIHQLTTLDPAKRLSAEEAQRHPFVSTAGSQSSSSRAAAGGGVEQRGGGGGEHQHRNYQDHRGGHHGDRSHRDRHREHRHDRERDRGGHGGHRR